MNERRRRLLATSAGLTAVELVVVTGILSVLTGLVYGTFRYQTASYATSTAANWTQNDLRQWLTRAVRDIRRAGYDPLGVNDPAATTPTFGILEFGSEILRFTADVDGDGTLDAGATESMGLRLNGTDVELWLGGSAWRPVIPNVTSLVIGYRDVAGDPATERRDVRIVDVTVSAQATTGVTPGAPPPILSQTMSAELRNPIY